MVKTLEEERDVSRNDFVIKFDSMSKELDDSRSENSDLKVKLTKFETPTTLTAVATSNSSSSQAAQEEKEKKPLSAQQRSFF